VVLAGGVLLSLAANLAQAQPTTWGRIVDAVPPAAFLVAVSMIERRAAPAAGAVCPRGSTARRARRGAGGGSTGTAKAWQPTGTGSPGPRRDGPLRERRAFGRVPGAGARDGQQN
jgi:hypothetical protein